MLFDENERVHELEDKWVRMNGHLIIKRFFNFIDLGPEYIGIWYQKSGRSKIHFTID